MKRSTYDAILSFLLGVSWAFIIIGAWVVFSLFSFLGFPTALFFTAMFVFAGLFGILLLETMSLYREKVEEVKKQTRLLQDIRNRLKES